MLTDQLFDVGQILGNESNINSGLFSQDQDGIKIYNESVITILFHILPLCDGKIQEFIFDTFSNLLNGKASLVNLATSSNSKPPMLDMALDLFPILPEHSQEYLVRLLKSLGKHSISVSQMKHLFRIMQTPGATRHNWRVLEVRINVIELRIIFLIIFIFKT